MTKINYPGYRFPPEIIRQAIWLYLRFTLSLRDVEDLLAERGVAVSYETVRRWVNHFGPMIGANLRKRRPKPHTTWHPRRGLSENRRPNGLSLAGALSRCQGENATFHDLSGCQAAATAVRHMVIAAARSARCVWAERRWRWTLKVL